MSLVDRAIELFSPKWAAERAYFRSVLELSRAYDAGKLGRRTDGWHTPGTSANAEIGPAAFRVRSRARDLIRNNPYAKRASRILPAKIVGAGITPRLSIEDKAAKQAAADDWARFVEGADPERRCDAYGLQHLTAGAVGESGETLHLYLPRPASWRMEIPLQVLVLEPEYLDSTKEGVADSGGVIVQGVEFDRWGRRVAYWLFDDHPGDLSTFTRRAPISRRVDAAFVEHVFDRTRPGQVRGVSWFAPVAMKFRDLGDYDEAELVRRKIAACFAAFVKRGNGNPGSPLAATTKTDTNGRRIENLAPGIVQYLGFDEDVTFASPPSVDGYREYMDVQLHAIAAGTGTTYEQLTGDLTNVNFSSARVGLIDFFALLDVWQWHMMIPQACDPMWLRVQQLRVALGRAQRVEGATWATPERPWVDPEAEVKGQLLAIRGGLRTLPESVAARGVDPDEHLDEIAATNARLDKLGIILDSDPRHRTAVGNVPAAGSVADQKTSKESVNA